MRRSVASLLIPLVAAAAPAAAAAPVSHPALISADEAMTAYRTAFQAVVDPCAAPAADAGEIVVCGEREDGPSPYRAPIALPPAPGTRVAGEPLTTVEAMGSRERCSTVGMDQACSGGLPVFQMIGLGLKVIEALVTPEE